ncbi:hypothetical protein EGW08_016741 [Elysia chlorotica]|uniref:MYND-type domain-containing protein n=1 Tax=Elysia chlorotica TaxID=188477 RepID=A0A3S0ZC55_ELYCH|nr:hypothetical protein EGW08_016741 [Elysia chlorotica]
MLKENPEADPACGQNDMQRSNEQSRPDMDSLTVPDGKDVSPKAAEIDKIEVLQAFYESLIQDAPIEIQRIKSNGSFSLQTSRKIHKGDVLFQETPAYLEQEVTSCTISACSNCGISLVRPEEVFSSGHLASPDLKRALKKCWRKREVTPCASCSRVVYCSEMCRAKAWESHHKAICPSTSNTPTAMLYDVTESFRQVLASDGSSWQGWWNAEFSPLFVARLVSSLLLCGHGMGSLTLNTDTSGGGSNTELFAQSLTDLGRKFPLRPKSGPSPSEAIPNMRDLTSNIFKRLRLARLKLSQQDFDTVYRILLANCREFYDPTDPLTSFIWKVTKDKKLYNKVGKYFQGQPPRAKFHGLFPLGACLSHSCMPNVELVSEIVGERPSLVARATKDIDAGEELSISLVNVGGNKNQRQETLWRRRKDVVWH